MRFPIMLTTTLVLASACGSAEVSDAALDTSTGGLEHPDAGGEAERAQVLAALQQVFDALESGDGALLRQVMDPDIRMHSIDLREEGAGTVTTSDLGGLVARVTTSTTPLIERMWDAEVRVRGSLATIWTPYDFYAGSEFSHCGIDAATLERTSDGWKVIALSWTREEPPTCALHPDGPPDA